VPTDPAVPPSESGDDVTTETKIAVALLYVLLGLWLLARWRGWDRMWRLLTPVIFAVVGAGLVLSFVSIWMQP
jgi:hypothetical protein